MNYNLFTGAGRFGLLAALCLSGFVASSAQQVANTPASVAAASGAGPDTARPSTGEQYRIGARDVLTIRVTAPDIVPQFSAEAMEVNECGMIPLLSVQNEEQNEIKAAGMTTNELQETLRKFYTKYKRNPQVVVKVKEYNSQPVAINGAVARPGQFQLRRPVRLLELLQFYAGGPTERSGGRIQIVRMPALGACDAKPEGTQTAAVIDEGAGPSFLSFMLEDTQKGAEQANPFLQPGDVITLPEAKEAYVIGNVLRPGPVLLRDDHLTVTRALAMAGGKLPDTKMDKVIIVRPDPKGGEGQEITVNLKAIKDGKAEDPVIRPNDIVEVPVSGGRRLLRSLVGTVVPSVGNLPVQVIR
ncbi:MAG: polysaccharide biosynthesis/export family protein [Acidobacteria bacterium]|nr:polysaccharide biosynthesis/export family protein [Acidobacteriota bacterium]